MHSLKPTAGQLERSLSQAIQKLYRDRLGHRLGKVGCHLFEEKLVIVLENSTTLPEQVLLEEGHLALAEEIRKALIKAICPYLRALIEEVLDIEVLDLMENSILETGRTGIIVVFDHTPMVRNPDGIPKAKLSFSLNH